jgi:hypothetical protein
MQGRRKFGLMFAALNLAAPIAGAARADNASSKVQSADAETKQLPLLMDVDRNGKVSKQDFMTFMEAEFNRLHTNKDGELDVHELTGPRVRRSVPGHQGK